MNGQNGMRLLSYAAVLAAIGLSGTAAKAQEPIKIGITAPMSGAGALWGKACEWLCKRAAQEIKDAGGVKVKGQSYTFDCIANDNKMNASEGARVAQTLLNRDNVKYLYGFGTAAILAAQTLTERQGVVLMNTSWGMSSKGPKFPLTFAVNNTPVEIMPAVAKYVTTTHPDAKTIVLLNANDASGREAESVYRPTWEKMGVNVIASDYYERGTTEFQPIATRIASLKPDMVDIGSAPPSEAGMVFKELDVLGYKGLKIMTNGGSAEAFLATAGEKAGEGVYMGAALVFDGPTISKRQRKMNDGARAAVGDGLGTVVISAYDMIYMIKAAMEKAQSIEPNDVAAVMSSINYKTFYGGETGFGGKEIYGADIAPQLPVYITRVANGKLVEKARIDPQVK
jgi:branched-chain amino acid transport system substrate-binding protein